MSWGRNIVLLAFDGFDGDCGDLTHIDFVTRDDKFVFGDFALFEDAVHGRQIEFCGHVHDSEIFVVEFVVLVMIASLVFGDAGNLIGEGFGVFLGVHGDKGGELQKARINLAANAFIFEADPLDHAFFELAHCDAAAKVCDVCGRCIGVNGAADERERAGLRFGLFLGEIGCGCECERDRLAHGDHMRVGAKFFHEVNEIEGVVLDIKLAFRDGNVAGVVPICDVDLTVADQALYGGAQERGIVARHRGNDQYLAGRFFTACHVKVDQIAKGAFDNFLDFDEVIFAIVAGESVNAPVRLGDHAFEAALCHFAPSGEPLKSRVWRESKSGVRCKGLGGCAEPLVGIAKRFHEVVAGHIAHVGVLCFLCADLGSVTSSRC